jgi:hypothetical protein
MMPREAPADRTISDLPNYITPAGFRRVSEELAQRR